VGVSRQQAFREYRERNTKDERNRRILEMYKGGATTGQIKAALADSGEPISQPTICNIIRRELDKARAERMELSHAIIENEMERLTMILRHNWTIVTSLCRVCEGRGELQVEAIPGVAATGGSVVCDACRGDRHANPPSLRIKASKEARAAIDQRVKMLGGYAPDKIVLSNPDGSKLDFRPELAEMSQDEIDRALADYSAGVEAALELSKLADARTSS
jgi:hypothetical protein